MPDTTAPSTLASDMDVNFPWMKQMGLTPGQLQDMLATASGDSEMVQKIRATPQYKQRFPGLYRPDGSMRMNESQYLQTEDAFATKLTQYGFGGQYDRSNPSAFVGLFDSEQDVNELETRLKTYRSIQESGQATKDAFYVYAGIKLSDDDLFAATVDPAASQKLADTYNQNVAKSSFDYTTWISRATELGLDRVSSTLSGLQSNGAVTSSAVQEVMRTDPNFARQIMDALYHGAGTGGPTLQLDELLSSFEYAAIGAAATNAGLSLPDKQRIAQIRSAGIDRAAAQKTYSQYGSQANNYDELVRRATGTGFGQTDFESAAFLGDSSKQSALATGLAREDAAGQQQGGVRFEQNRQGRLTQNGLKAV